MLNDENDIILSQQAKIDELKMSNHHLSVQLVDSNAHYDHVKKERDELQAIVYGLKRVQNNLELKAEDAECVSMSLDDQGVAKCDDDGKPYSLWGRVCQFKKSNNITV